MGLQYHMVLRYHVGVSSAYETVGRTAHKQRRRRAIVDATRALLADGVTPTVEQAALAAGVSRTTAYRYFPNRRALLAATHPEIEAVSLLGQDPPADARGRVDRVLDTITRLTLENEPELRATLRLSLERDGGDHGALHLRQGRAIAWLEEALAPLGDRMSAEEVRRLALAMRCACGIEALVWLTDVAQLDREEATELMRWSALTLLTAATEDDATPRARRRPSAAAHDGAEP